MKPVVPQEQRPAQRKRHNTIDTENPKAQYRSRSLPHWSNGNSPVFITYRLKFTLPAEKTIELNEKKTEWYKELQSLEPEAKETKLKTKDGLFFTWFDELISQADEVPQFLHKQEITDIIADSFRYFDKIRYQLLAYCIMPNHVHVLILPLMQGNGKIYPLSHITYTWKKFTATAINRRIDKDGSLWQAESYDHLVRDELELAGVIDYILQNPVKAGLVEKWEDWYGTWLNVTQALPVAQDAVPAK